MDIYISKKVDLIHYYNELMIIVLKDGRQIFVSNSTVQMLIHKVATGYSLDGIIESIDKNGNGKKGFETFIKEQLKNGKLKEIFTEESHGKEVPITGMKGRRIPLRIQIEITRACNLNCLHCYKIANKDYSSIGFEDVKRLLNIFKEPLYEIGITGGEPTTHKDFIAITKLAAARGQKLALNTNGILLSTFPPDVIKMYKYISISLYGTSDEEYTQICNMRAAFSRLKISTQLLKDNEISFNISVLLDKKNFVRIEEYISIAIELNATSIQFGVKAKIGRGKLFEDYIPYLDDEQIDYVYRIIKEMNRKYKDKIEVKEWFREWFKRRTIFQDTCFTCEAGSLQWIITEKGKFKPCVVLPEEKELEFTEDFFVDYLNLKKEIKWNRYYSKLNEYCICEHMKPKDFCDRIKEPIKE